jgi:hypothetical protein
MWWKLGILSAITAVLIFCVIPIRTHAVMIDPANPPLPAKPSLSAIISNMYLTPGTVGLIIILLASACFVGFRIIRSS